MKYFFILLFCSISALAFCQELPRAVKKVNPSLFINNMENERVYQQANIRENLVVFLRDFGNRSIEEAQQSFHYSFLDEKDKTCLLEFQFDRHDIKLHHGLNMEPVGCNDFGFKIYTKKDNEWRDGTLESLPDDFLIVVTKHFQTLQKGSLGMYFYNQDPEQAVSMNLEKNKLFFKQNGKIKLSLVWKKGRFCWKNKSEN